MVLSGKRAKREADLASDIKKDNASDNIEVGTRPSSTTSIKENAGNSNVVGNVTNNDLTTPPKDRPKDYHPCRFCDKIFEKSQALGGHMNKHRAEKEEEVFRKARSLVETKQQILFGSSIPWPNYGRGGGAGNHSQYGPNLSSNAHIVGTSTTSQSYPNQSASIQQNQIQRNQSVLPQQQIQVPVHGHQGGVNIIRGSHLHSLESTRTHHGTPASQTDVIVTGQHQAHHGAWVNSGQHPGQMAYPGLHGGTDFHVQHQVNQAGPSQSLQDLAQSSNVPMASYTQQYPQEHPTNVQFVELAQIHQPVQYCYEVVHPNQYSYHLHAPQDGSQTSIDEKSESLMRNQSVGSDNQNPEQHILQEGTDHKADPVGECGAETPNDKVGGAHGLFNEE